MEKRKIPLDTSLPYWVSEDGRVFSGENAERELKGWIHYYWSPSKGFDYSKKYVRYTLMTNTAKPGQPKKFKRKYFYGQRLSAMVWHGLKPNDERIVRHLKNSLDNGKDSIIPGTHMENQNVDRLEQGTYWNRGGAKRDEDVGF